MNASPTVWYGVTMVRKLIIAVVYGLVLLGLGMPMVATVAMAGAAVEVTTDTELHATQAVVKSATNEPCCKHLYSSGGYCFGDVTPVGMNDGRILALAGPPPWPGEKSHVKTGEPAPMLRPPISLS